MGPYYGSLLLTLSLIVGCDGPAATDSRTADRRGRPSASAKGPIAEFEDVTLDLGEVPLRSHSDHLEAIIRVKNAGDEPLRFDRLVMSCGCTEAKPMQEEIAAGETGEIAVRIEVTTSGSRKVSVTAHSNTVGRSSTTVNIRWNAMAPIECTPAEIDFGGIAPETVLDSTITFVQSKFGECSASQISVAPGFHSTHELSAELVEPLKLQIRMKAGKTPGQFVEYVPLELTDCWRNTIRIPLRWEVQPRVFGKSA